MCAPLRDASLLPQVDAPDRVTPTNLLPAEFLRDAAGAASACAWVQSLAVRPQHLCWRPAGRSSSTNTSSVPCSS